MIRLSLIIFLLSFSSTTQAEESRLETLERYAVISRERIEALEKQTTLMTEMLEITARKFHQQDQQIKELQEFIKEKQAERQVLETVGQKIKQQGM